MFEVDQRIWRVSDQKGALGLSCADDGLFLGNTPLLERRGCGFVPRAQTELETLLGRGFGFAISLDYVMGGLGAVASALNAGDLCRARIAAVHLRLPDLADEFACLDMQIEDIALKLNQIAKTTAAGDWAPDKHPRAGTAPNPGWFAPTSGGDGDVAATLVSDKPDDDGRLHLPPGERNDEAGDLLEWIANSKPEDTQAIRAEIKRLYFDVGDKMGASALHQALSEVLEDPSTETRQWVLDNYEIYTRTDPAEVGQFGRDLLSGALLGSLSGGIRPSARSAEAEAAESAPAAETATQEGTAANPERAAAAQEETAATEGGAAAATQERPSPFWDLGWGARGRAIHDAMGGSLPWWFKGIDDFRNGIATSFKSIDLNAATYQNDQNLASAVNRYVNNLAAFNGKSYAGWEVKAEQITGRALNLIVPRGSMTETQQTVIDAAIERAKSRGISLFVTPF